MLAFGSHRLLIAASEGDCDMISKILQEEKVSPSFEFQHGITALHEACEGGHIEATQLLIDHGADVNKQVLLEDITLSIIQCTDSDCMV